MNAHGHLSLYEHGISRAWEEAYREFFEDQSLIFDEYFDSDTAGFVIEGIDKKLAPYVAVFPSEAVAMEAA